VRYTLSPKLHLSRLPLPTRVVLTCFVVMIEAALLVGAQKYRDRAEFTPAGAQRYLHGDAPATAPGEELLPGEDDIEEGGGLRAEAPRKSARQLVDLVHPHLFTVPIVQFILLHLLILTRLPDRWKIGLTLHAFLSCAATFGLPFVVASSGAGAAGFIAAGASLLLSFAGVGALLLVELWRPADAPTPSSGDELDPQRQVV
jgi:hypothetical protein